MKARRVLTEVCLVAQRDQQHPDAAREAHAGRSRRGPAATRQACSPTAVRPRLNQADRVKAAFYQVALAVRKVTTDPAISNSAIVTS